MTTLYPITVWQPRQTVDTALLGSPPPLTFGWREAAFDDLARRSPAEALRRVPLTVSLSDPKVHAHFYKKLIHAPAPIGTEAMRGLGIAYWVQSHASPDGFDLGCSDHAIACFEHVAQSSEPVYRTSGRALRQDAIFSRFRQRWTGLDHRQWIQSNDPAPPHPGRYFDRWALNETLKAFGERTADPISLADDLVPLRLLLAQDLDAEAQDVVTTQLLPAILALGSVDKATACIQALVHNPSAGAIVDAFKLSDPSGGRERDAT